MKGFIAWLLEALGTIKAPEQPPRYLRLRITRSLLLALHRATLPTATNGEPLAFLCARFASESVTDVIVAVEIAIVERRRLSPAGYARLTLQKVGQRFGLGIDRLAAVRRRRIDRKRSWV